MTTYRDVLRCLAMNDRRFLERDLALDTNVDQSSPLSPMVQSLVRVAVLVADDAPTEAFRWAIDDALEWGADAEDVVAILGAVAPLTGITKVVAAAPKVALALDYDVDAALEALDT